MQKSKIFFIVLCSCEKGELKANKKPWLYKTWAAKFVDLKAFTC